MKRITVVFSSPRKSGNSDSLAEEFIKGALSTGNEVNKIIIRDLSINGCLGCEYCYESNGRCSQNDDMVRIYEVLEKTDVIVFATPIYYQGFPSQLKAFVDRLYVMENRQFPIKEACLLATYASKGIEMAEMTILYYNKLIEYHGWSDIGVLTIDKLDEKSDILMNTEALAAAYRLGEAIH